MRPVSPIDNGTGRDPRTVAAAQWRSWGLVRHTGMELVRLKCFDCAYTAGEIRKCVQFKCPLWPYRMGSVPKGLRALEHQDDHALSGASGLSTPSHTSGAAPLVNPPDPNCSEGAM